MNATQTTITQTVDDPLFTVQDRRRKGFFTVDNELYDRFGSEIGPYGLAVYMGLARFANQESECFPSQSTLAKRAGMSRMQVSREIEKLKDLNLIGVEQQFGANGGQRANLYILLDLPPVTVSDTPCNRQLLPPVTVSDTPCNRQLHKQNNRSNNTHQEQDLDQQPRRRHNQNGDASLDDVTPSKQDVVVVLTDLGISSTVAARLTKRYSRARILEKVTYLEFLQVEDPDKVQNPCGWLRSAIEENYAPPDGFMPPEERERQQAEEVRTAQEEIKQARLLEETEQAFQEKKKTEQEAHRQALTGQYGTTEADFAFWEQAQWEIKYATPAHIAALTADMDILTVTDASVVVGVERDDVWRQLQHPGIQIALNRALSSVAGRPVKIEAHELYLPTCSTLEGYGHA